MSFDLNKPLEFTFTQIYSTLCIGFLIAMTFSVVAPLVLIFACMIFSLAFLVMKYQLMVCGVLQRIIF
jgi:hypothetical protein